MKSARSLFMGGGGEVDKNRPYFVNMGQLTAY
jgi:hypothetical protein